MISNLKASLLPPCSWFGSLQWSQAGTKSLLTRFLSLVELKCSPTASALGRGSGMGPTVLAPNLGGILRDSTRSSGTHHPHQGVTPGLSRDTGFRTCLCQRSSSSAEIPPWHDLEQDPGARAKESGAEQGGQRAGGKRCPRTCRAAPHRSRAGPGPPRGAPSPAVPPGALPPPETAPDFTRLWNGIPEISSQLSPDAPAVKTNPNYQRLLVPFLCHRHY